MISFVLLKGVILFLDKDMNLNSILKTKSNIDDEFAFPSFKYIININLSVIELKI